MSLFNRNSMVISLLFIPVWNFAAQLLLKNLQDIFKRNCNEREEENEYCQFTN